MKNENKSLIIILYIIMLIIAIGGPIIALKEESNVHVLEDYEDDYEHENDQEEDLEDEEDYENDEYASYVDVDKVLKQYNITVTSEDRIDLIKSSDTTLVMSDEFVGEMYKEEISDYYKLLYTISFISKKTDYATLDLALGESGYKQIKKETLLKYAKMLFDDVEIPTNIDSKLHYHWISDLSCKGDICTFHQLPGGAESPLINGYESYVDDRGDQLIVDAFYVEYNNSNLSEEDSNYAFADIVLKDNFNGKAVNTLPDYKLQVGFESEDEYDPNARFFEFSAKMDEIPRYTFNFNEKNVLLSVEQG